MSSSKVASAGNFLSTPRFYESVYFQTIIVYIYSSLKVLAQVGRQYKESRSVRERINVSLASPRRILSSVVLFSECRQSKLIDEVEL